MAMALEQAVEDARTALESAGETRGRRTGGHVRYELFHAANSVCSQKVRAVLAHHRLPYVEHTLNLFLGQTYLPGYVRMRMIGCDSFGGALVSHHSGSTSASAGGCDGAVVPTLVDWSGGTVLVDSWRICAHLDEQVPELAKLIPASLAEDIEDQLRIVDNLPNYQMLMGRTPRGSEDKAVTGGVAGQFSQRKVAWCDQYLHEHGDDPALRAAYTAKRAKELSAAEELFSAEAMAEAYGRAGKALHDLGQLLGRGRQDWLIGSSVTMADLFWGIALLRMNNLGLASMWDAGKLPHVERYQAATEALPALREAVIEWPGALF